MRDLEFRVGGRTLPPSCHSQDSGVVAGPSVSADHTWLAWRGGELELCLELGYEAPLLG